MLKKTFIDSSLPKSSKLNLGLKALGVAALFSATSAQAVLPVAPDFVKPTSLKLEKAPEPSNLYDFVQNKSAAIALGKALFWDMRVGTDGDVACASCHFSAGTDTRVKNTLGRAHDRTVFDSKPNDILVTADFPFVKFKDILTNDKNGEQPVKELRDVVGAQGVNKALFLRADAAAPKDEFQIVMDELFNVGGINVYQSTGRNSPTVINSIFNLRNFWDGRAQTIFNGVSPFGKRDKSAGVYKTINGKPTKVAITLNDSSIASLATGPVLDNIEMSSNGRRFANVGRRLLTAKALADQPVASDDSVLASLRASNGVGLTKTYQEMIREAYKPEWWSATDVVTMSGAPYSQTEANFSLLFGLSVQLYVATLVSDETPFDKFAEGNSTALTAQQKRGFDLFLDKGKCVSCHGGPNFSGTSIFKRDKQLGKTERMSRMIMGDGGQAVYDEAFYNIGVTRTQDDVGVGGLDPFGNPLSFTRLAKKGIASFYWNELDFPNVNVQANERDAVQGSFKTPTLRNVALTAPYFHNGGYLTLRQVVEFYNRGGNFPKNNRDNLAPDIVPLGLSNSEIDDLVAFLESLTDPRVAKHSAPFDHPQLDVAHGVNGDTKSVVEDPKVPGTGAEITLVIPAVGKNGYANNPIKSFAQNLVDGVKDTVTAPPPAPLPTPDLAKLVWCANENNVCNLPTGKSATVFYGASLTQYTGKTGVTGSIGCNNTTFGDPAKGIVKGCYYMF